MAKILTYTDADAAFRHAIYEFIVTPGHAPKIRELAAKSDCALRSGA